MNYVSVVVVLFVYDEVLVMSFQEIVVTSIIIRCDIKRGDS